MRNLKRTSMAIPEQLREWLDREAITHGRSRNSLVIYLLEQARDANLLRRVERLEREWKQLTSMILRD